MAKVVWEENATTLLLIMGSVLVIILSTSELLQMKRQLVLTVVGLQPQRREHILILHSVLSDCALRMDVI